MNERINELLKQSRTEYWTQYTPSYDYEKFAELIVKACAKVLDEDSYLIPELGGYAHDIRKMFGVKE
jgi:hypothetical protein